jgi:hypothetical protein
VIDLDNIRKAIEFLSVAVKESRVTTITVSCFNNMRPSVCVHDGLDGDAEYLDDMVMFHVNDNPVEPIK